MARSSQYPPSVDPGPPVEPPTPRGWKRHSFGELLEVVERPIELDDDATYQLVNAKRNRGGITPRDRLLGREIRVKTQFRVNAGDFLISKRQIIHGACGLVPQELDGAIVSNEYACLRPRPGLDVGFLRYLSFTTYFQRTCFHSSVGVDVEKMVFKLERWFQYHVPVPPLREQVEVVSVLSGAERAIEGAHAAIAQLKTAKRAAAADLFSRGLPGRHTEFKNTEVGRIPSAWQVRRVAEVAKTTSGGTPSRAEPRYWNGTIPWVKTGEIDYGLVTETEEHITREGVECSAAKVVPRGSLLMAMYGQGATRGRVALLGIDAAINQACLAFLPGGQVLNPFLFAWFSTQYDSLRRIGNETTQKNLSASLIGALALPVPSSEEQERIAAVLGQFDQCLSVAAEHLRAATQLRAALLNDLLSGRSRVPGKAEVAA